MKSPAVRVAILAALLVILSGGLTGCASNTGGARPSAFDGYMWTRAVEVDEVSIRLHVLSPEELREVREEYAPRRDRRIHRAPDRSHKGFAVLVRQDGEYHCRIYVTPQADEQALEHERLHCHGWVH